MCFVVNKFLHLFQVLRNFQNTATAINAPPSPLLIVNNVQKESFVFKSLHLLYVVHNIVSDLYLPIPIPIKNADTRYFSTALIISNKIIS